MNNQQTEYQNYQQPPLAPPPYIFGIVWPILYILIAISYGYVFYQAWKGAIRWQITIPFIINLIANGLYTYLQFGLQNFALATVDVIILLVTIIITIVVIWPIYRWVAYLQIPYLLWVLFATYLQIGVTILNR